jgi:hypothetical protein
LTSAWTQRVSSYLDELVTATETIDLVLDEIQLATRNVQPEKITTLTQQLSALIEDLAELVKKREALLLDEDAPENGGTLIDKLYSTHIIEDARIAKRCQKVSGTVEMTHTRAVSLFVCHYHLTALSNDIVRLLSGERNPPTYSKKQAQHRGGLFNEAA